MIRHVIKGFLALGFMGVIYWYIATAYFGHLHFLEQMQLFLLTQDFFMEHVTRVEGLSDYLGQATVQFFVCTEWGAFFIAFLLGALQFLIAWIYKLLGHERLEYYSLSFFPSIALSFFLLNHQARLTLPWALLLTAICIIIYLKAFAQNRNQLYFVLFSAALLYWMGGGATLSYIMVVVLHRLLVSKKYSSHEWLATLLILLAGITLPLAARFITVSPLGSLWTGIGYLCEPEIVSSDFWLMEGVFLVTIVLPMILPSNKITWVEYAGCAATTGIALLWWINGGVSRSENEYEQQMRFDYWVRIEQWDSIIRYSQKVHPIDQMTASCLNLALAEKNVLPEHIFDYRPNHPHQLLNAIHYNYFEPHHMGEIYFRLGFINTAQRFSNEAMSLMGNRIKSVRSYQRMAETNLIKGRYKIARKFLLVLQNTYAYRKWADERMGLLNNEESIEKHPVYGRLRHFAPKTDYLEAEKTTEERLKLMVSDHPDNLMARHYYLCWLMLNKSVGHFPQALMDIYKPEEKMPTVYQEAFLFGWTAIMQRKIEDLPLKIEQKNIDRMLDFARLHRHHVHPFQYTNTYWYYQFYVKPQK